MEIVAKQTPNLLVFQTTLKFNIKCDVWGVFVIKCCISRYLRLLALRSHILYGMAYNSYINFRRPFPSTVPLAVYIRRYIKMNRKYICQTQYCVQEGGNRLTFSNIYISYYTASTTDVPNLATEIMMSIKL